jgi:SNF2 family DNA or RNA helicase
MSAYEPRIKLRDYQLEGLEKMHGRRAFALLMAMRTGKTATLLADYGRMESAGQVRDLLVLAPKGVYLTWTDEIDKHLSQELRKRTRLAVYAAGKKVDEDFLEDLSKPRILLVNVEALSATAYAREVCERFARGSLCMIVVDESTVIKNRGTKRTKYIVKHLGPLGAFRRILSGLPTPRSPLDIFYQFEFLEPGLLGYRGGWWEFRAAHAIIRKMEYGGRRFEVEVGYRNVEEIQRRVAPHAHRVEFRPEFPSTYSSREVEMTPEQRKLYQELKLFATASLANEGGYVTATMVITQILRLHQVLCGHVVDECGIEHTVAENRTDTLIELLSNYAGKAIIWASYDHSIRKIAEALHVFDRQRVTKAGELVYDESGKPVLEEQVVARFWGGNESTREAEERRFKTDPNCRFMVATPNAGGRGRTWDVADLVIYYSSTNNLELRDQSEQRCQGVGKKRQVDYIDLICPGTVEDKILNALRRKMDMAALITGDAWREWIV